MFANRALAASGSTADSLVHKTDTPFEKNNAPADSQTQSTQQRLGVRAGSCVFGGRVETPQSSTVYSGVLAFVQTQKMTDENPDAEKIDERASSLTKSSGLQSLDKPVSDAATASQANQSADKNLAVLHPIEDFRECHSLMQDINHCQAVPLAGHRFKRIIEGLQADAKAGSLSHLSLELVKALTANQAKHIASVHAPTYQRLMIDQLEKVALESLKTIKVPDTPTAMTFETMSLLINLLKNLRVYDQHRSLDTKLPKLTDVSVELGEVLLKWLAQPSNHHYQTQIFDELGQSVHILSKGTQKRLHELATNDEPDYQGMSRSSQALLLSSLIRHARASIVNGKQEAKTDFVALLGKAVTHLEKGHDTSNANLLSTLDSTFLQLTPRNADTTLPGSFEALKARFLEVRAQVLQKLSPFASSSVHGRLLTLGRELPASDIYSKLNAQSEASY